VSGGSGTLKPNGRRGVFSRIYWVSFIGKEFVVYLFIVHRLDNADADRMMDHQPCQQVAVNQNNLIFVTFREFFRWLCEIGSCWQPSVFTIAPQVINDKCPGAFKA
jgi:hypothetical protein